MVTLLAHQSLLVHYVPLIANHALLLLAVNVLKEILKTVLLLLLVLVAALEELLHAPNFMMQHLVLLVMVNNLTVFASNAIQVITVLHVLHTKFAQPVLQDKDYLPLQELSTNASYVMSIVKLMIALLVQALVLLPLIVKLAGLLI